MSCLNYYILSQRFESLTIFLHNRNCDVTRFTCLNIFNYSRFACVSSYYNFASATIFYLILLYLLHNTHSFLFCHMLCLANTHDCNHNGASAAESI